MRGGLREASPPEGTLDSSSDWLSAFENRSISSDPIVGEEYYEYHPALIQTVNTTCYAAYRSLTTKRRESWAPERG